MRVTKPSYFTSVQNEKKCPKKGVLANCPNLIYVAGKRHMFFFNKLRTLLRTNPVYFLKRWQKKSALHFPYWFSRIRGRIFWPVAIDGLTVKLGFFHPYQHHVAETLFNNEHENRLLTLWKKKVETLQADGKNTVLDVGGYNGVYGLVAALANPKIQIYIFEPDGINADHISKNIALNGVSNATVVRAAVSDHCGKILFYTDGGHPGANLYGAGNATVECLTLDGWCLEKQLKPVLIKFDIEGAELRALQGMKNASPEILLEVHQQFLPYFGDSREVLFKYLEGREYDWAYLDGNDVTSHYWVYRKR